MTLGIETTLSNIALFLRTVALTLSIILITLAGIVYGLAQAQPPEVRGKWQNTSIAILIGGVIIAAIASRQSKIQEISSGLLTFVF